MNTNQCPKISEVLVGFTEYMSAERRFSPRTVKNYGEACRYFAKELGDLGVSEIELRHFISLKARMEVRGTGASRVASIIVGMKCLLQYVRDVLGVAVMDLTGIRTPKAPSREVTYLTHDELGIFFAAIRLQTWTGEPRYSGYCFRALAETLLATGMRISEALALDRNSIDLVAKEAVIVGKGNKQRTVFFTDRALEWLQKYLALRRDSNPALFLSSRSRRLTIDAVGRTFCRVRTWAGLEKHVTPHTLRHTTATNLLANGCPIGFIREVLGHQRLETTCRYYLGILNRADTKKAHEKYSCLAA
ncbi:MAG: tyrosine-type recombinase/integrase [Terriglobia bacterium]|nr:tyrosine-type recombinase/integrase [Terriglobia bacterium]